jgi:hypothetical protein
VLDAARADHAIVPGANFRLVSRREDRADVVAEDQDGMRQGARRNGTDIESGSPFAKGADILRQRFFQVIAPEEVGGPSGSGRVGRLGTPPLVIAADINGLLK